MELAIPAIISLLTFAINNGPRVADMIARHQSGAEPLTPEAIQALITAAQSESGAVNEDWKNS
jgi:hypothetical protein